MKPAQAQARRAAGARQADGEADLAARRSRQELAEPDEIGEGVFIEPPPPGDELAAEIAQMRDRPAEAGEAQPEEDAAQHFDGRAGSASPAGDIGTRRGHVREARVMASAAKPVIANAESSRHGERGQAAVMASAAKQSKVVEGRRRRLVDCFAALAMTEDHRPDRAFLSPAAPFQSVRRNFLQLRNSRAPPPISGKCRKAPKVRREGSLCKSGEASASESGS